MQKLQNLQIPSCFSTYHSFRSLKLTRIILVNIHLRIYIFCRVLCNLAKSVLFQSMADSFWNILRSPWVNILCTVFPARHKTATGWLRRCWLVRMSSSFTYLLHLLLVNTCVSSCHINLLSSPLLFYSVLLRLPCQQVLLFIMQHTAILNRANSPCSWII